MFPLRLCEAMALGQGKVDPASVLYAVSMSPIAAVWAGRIAPDVVHKVGKPVIEPATVPEPTSPPVMVTAGSGGFGAVHVTPVPPSAAKPPARPSGGGIGPAASTGVA